MPQPPPWTNARALAAGCAFVAREQRLPHSDDLRASLRLPPGNVIRRLFGSVDAYLQCLPTPEPPYLPPLRHCLGCDVLFQPAGKECLVLDGYQKAALTCDWNHPQ